MESIVVAGREGTMERCWAFPKQADKLASLPKKDNGFDALGNTVEILNFVKGYTNCEIM